jgi:hypothetical protein
MSVNPLLREDAARWRRLSEQAGALLAAAGLSFKCTRTSKASPDPDCEAKAAHILALCEKPPPDRARVLAIPNTHARMSAVYDSRTRFGVAGRGRQCRS